MGLTTIFKWRERSGFKNFEDSSHNKIGFKFKKVKDYISVRSDNSELEDPKIDFQNLKINTITMKDGFCFICSDGEYNGKKVDRIETYAYTTYVKELPYPPNFFNLL